MHQFWSLASLSPREWLVGFLAAGFDVGLVLIAVKFVIWGWGSKDEKRSSDKWWK